MTSVTTTVAAATTTTSTRPEIKISEKYKSFVAPLTHAEYNSLKDSIDKHGQKVPGIVNRDGVLLDGHHRYRACQELGKSFKYKVNDEPANEAEDLPFGPLTTIIDTLQ